MIRFLRYLEGKNLPSQLQHCVRIVGELDVFVFEMRELFLKENVKLPDSDGEI
jgi:hypothetical protein